MLYKTFLLFMLALLGSNLSAALAQTDRPTEPSRNELLSHIELLEKQNRRLMNIRTIQEKELEALKQQLAASQKPADTTAEEPPVETEDLTPQTAKIWEADLAVGASLTRGNNDSHRVHAKISGKRRTNIDELDLGLEAEVGENEGETTSEYIEAVGQYRRDISGKAYWYGLTQGRRDALADLDYRLSVGPGVGYRFLDTDTHTLVFEGGPVYVAEKLSHESLDHSVRARLFEEFTWQITSYAKFFQTAEFLANAQELSDWIFQLETGVETSITETLSLRLSAKDIYDNLPAEGRDKNDLSLNSAIVYRFF